MQGEWKSLLGERTVSATVATIWKEKGENSLKGNLGPGWEGSFSVLPECSEFAL